MLSIRDFLIPVWERVPAAAVAEYLLQGELAHAAWLGTADALESLGLNSELAVSHERVTSVLLGKHVDSDAQVRLSRSWNPDWESPTLVHHELTFRTPDFGTQRWRDAGAEQRAMIERALLRSAEQAVTHLVTGREVVRRRFVRGRWALEPALGFAAVGVVHRVRNEEGSLAATQPVARVVLLGAERSNGTLGELDPFVLREGCPEAQRVALQALLDEPSVRFGGRRALAAIRASGNPRSLEQDKERLQAGPRRPDPVEDWRKHVGDRRAEAIGARADDLAERVAERPFSELVSRRHAIRVELGSRDRAVARRALGFERDIAKLEIAMDEARREAAVLRTDAERVGGLERAHTLQAVAAIERQVEQQKSLSESMIMRSRTAVDRLDRWVSENVEQAAEMVAIDRELLARFYLRVERAVHAALQDPPAYLRDAIGEAPEVTSRAYDKWAAVATKLVHAHHAELANRAVGYELIPLGARERGKLQTQVRAVRKQRGLEPAVTDDRSLGPEFAA